MTGKESGIWHSHQLKVYIAGGDLGLKETEIEMSEAKTGEISSEEEGQKLREERPVQFQNEELAQPGPSGMQQETEKEMEEEPEIIQEPQDTVEEEIEISSTGEVNGMEITRTQKVKITRVNSKIPVLKERQNGKSTPHKELGVQVRQAAGPVTKVNEDNQNNSLQIISGKGVKATNKVAEVRPEPLVIPELHKPFYQGWIRRVSIRAQLSGKKRRYDIYYHYKNGIKIRSKPEMEKFLLKHPEMKLKITNFSFEGKALFTPPFEVITNLGVA